MMAPPPLRLIMPPAGGVLPLLAIDVGSVSAEIVAATFRLFVAWTAIVPPPFTPEALMALFIKTLVPVTITVPPISLVRPPDESASASTIVFRVTVPIGADRVTIPAEAVLDKTLIPKSV